MMKCNGIGSMFGEVKFGKKKDMPDDAKIKLKWKTIQFLLEHKRP